MPLASFSALPPLAELEPRWRALERIGEASFFLGWTWMGSWLAATGAKPELMAITEGGRDIALALVGRSMQPRLLGPAATLWLNQSGIPALDRPYIEYNGLLRAADAPAETDGVAMRALLKRNDWRALRLSGVLDAAPLAALGAFRRRVRIDRSPAYHVDLETVRAAAGDYLSLLSANTRNQIRRAGREHAPIRVSLATTTDVPEWLRAMQALNAGRHSDNAWDDPAFLTFVRILSETGIPSGEVELLRFDTDAGPIGYLVNFLHRGRAMNYQSAFAPPVSNKDKPGLLCHAAAVGHYADAGLSLYSLLAGKDRYKESLSTGFETLDWWSLERFSPRLELEALLRKILRRPASV